MQQVFSLIGSGLGDTWAIVSLLLRLSEQERRPSILNPIYLPAGDESARGEKFLKPRNLSTLIREVAVLFESSGQIEISYLHPNCLVTDEMVFTMPFLPCRYRWKPAASKMVCYQLAGIHNAKDKNVSEHEQKHFCKELRNAGFIPQALGLPLTLEKSAQLLSEALCFIGVDSGLMHVAYSVGTPPIMVRNNMSDAQIARCHSNRNFGLCRDIKHVLETICSTEEANINPG